MRLRITFLVGFAVGFVVGARAGRERYEQMVKLSRKVAENPAVQKATRHRGIEGGGAVQDREPPATKPGRHKAAEQMARRSPSRPRRSKVRDRPPRPDSGQTRYSPRPGDGTRPGD